MTAEVEAMPRAEFEAWLEQQARDQEAGTSNLGKETFAGACAKCHGLAGEGDIGLPLANNQLLNDPDVVEQIVREGVRTMPPVGTDWDDRQMDALTKFLAEGGLNGR
jgi:cytochrome c oxidase subunit 2